MGMIDRVTKSRSKNRKAFLVGLGSLIDLNGIATYEAMQDLMPSPDLTPLGKIFADTNRVMAQTPMPPTSPRSSSLK